jgi:hypothetical protein
VWSRYRGSGSGQIRGNLFRSASQGWCGGLHRFVCAGRRGFAFTGRYRQRPVRVRRSATSGGQLIIRLSPWAQSDHGSSVPQGVAAALNGVVLIRISLRLIRRSHDFLVGVWVLAPALQAGDADDLTQPIGPAEAKRMQALLTAYPGVTGMRELLVNFIGPGRVWIVARVDIDDDLRGAQVESLVRGIESSMRHEPENVYRVDVVPTGGDHRPTR